MAVHDHRSSDHHPAAASAVLGSFREFYDSAGTLRCTVFALAAGIRLSELVECASAVGTARGDELRGERGDIGAYAIGDRSGGPDCACPLTGRGPKSVLRDFSQTLRAPKGR